MLAGVPGGGEDRLSPNWITSGGNTSSKVADGEALL